MRIIAILISLALVTPVFATEIPKARLITVTGQGTLKAVPDMATVTMGVVSHGKTGADAMHINSNDLSRVIEKLSAAGVEARDIKTSNLSLSPRWDNRQYNSEQAPEIIGFIAQNTVTVRIRNMDAVGGILDAVLDSGANNFHGISFNLQEPRPAQDQARISAVKDAIAKATLLTGAAGVELGVVMSMSESTSGGFRPVAMGSMAMARSAVPVEAGEISVGVSVTMSFAIK